ncbi:hypothetical protein X975_12458, partial [Stegodyphus mimosarum]
MSHSLQLSYYISKSASKFCYAAYQYTVNVYILRILGSKLNGQCANDIRILIS